MRIDIISLFPEMFAGRWVIAFLSGLRTAD